MSPLLLLAAAGLAGLLSYLLTPLAGWLSVRLGAIDNPGHRKIHQVPIPRLGGLAVVTAVAVTIAALTARGYGLPVDFIVGLALGVIPILVVSMVDDIRPVPAIVKFLAQGVGAAIAISYGFTLGGSVHILGMEWSIATIAVPVSWFWIVGVTNAFNLTDGLDGLSAGLALISAISLAAVAVVARDAAQAIMSGVLVGALIGFLPFNTFPAKIFFGDTGAATVGFILACLGLWGTARLSSGMAVLVPIFVMGVPIADSLVTIVRRSIKPLLNRGRGDLFEPDQEHIHHRLLRKGFDHKDTVLVLYAVGVAIAAIGVLSIFLTSQSAAVVVVTLLAAATMGIRELDYEELAIVRNGLMLRMYDMPALRTGAFRVFIDIALVAVSVYLAFALKFDEWDLAFHRSLAGNLIVILFPLTLLLFVAFGLYRRSWRHSRLPDLLRTAAAIAASGLGAFVIGRFGLEHPPGLSYFIIYMLVLSAMILTVRMSFRLLLYWKGHEKGAGARVLVYGSDLEGAMALQELFWGDSGGLQPVGFIDDDPKNLNRLVNGFKVFGNLQSLERIARDHHVAGLVIGSGRISADQVALATQLCGRAGIWLKRFHIELHVLPTGDVTEDVRSSPPLEALVTPVPVIALASEDEDDRPAGESDEGWVAEQLCPNCRIGRAHRSRARSITERVRKTFSAKRLFRCEDCHWRGWAVPLTIAGESPLGPDMAPDLSSLDEIVQAPAASRPGFQASEFE